jgi:hypothetical protein
MGSDWRETGLQIFEHLKKRQVDRLLEIEMRRAAPRKTTPENVLLMALECSARGHSDVLIKYLLSDIDFSLSKQARERLAVSLREKDWERRGRRPEYHARYVCEQALGIYSTWKQVNKQNEVSDWGLRDQMKDEACRYALMLGKAYGWQPDFEQVRQLMERSKKRQSYERPAPVKRRQNKRPISA